ncbi:hypothetical protein JTB14_018745 [Gonioctena quinquepunctata]|nr:hypothetical protein JTB14_018745 [Gonioctena quinquepunctata]
MKQIDADPCTFVGDIDGFKIYLALYVDDGLILTKSKSVIEKILSNLSENFEITFGDARCYIGIEMKRNGESISITQQAFINKSLRKFNMLECKNSSVPAEPGNSLRKPIDTREIDETLKNIPYREAVELFCILP